MARVHQHLRRLRMRDTFTRNVASTVSVQVLTLLLALVTGAITARWLGAEGRGLLQLSLLAPAMLGLFLSGGIGVANVHFTGARRFDVPSLTANSLTFAILATLLGIAVVAIAATTGFTDWFLPGVPTGLLLVAMAGLPLTLLSGYFSTILQGLQRIVVVNRITLFNGILSLALTAVLVILFDLGIVGALLAVLATNAFSLGQMVFHLRKEGGIFIPKWDTAVMRATLGFGLRGHVGNVLQFYNYRLDVFVVNVFLGAASVGVYGVATRLAELVWYFPNAVGFVIFPKAASTSAREMNTFTPRVFRLTLAVTVLAAVGLAVIGKPLIVFIYSSAFVEAYIPMLALLPGVALLGAARVLTNDIAGRGYPQYNSVNSGISLVLTVVFDFLLIPRMGILGAGIASTIAYSVTFISALAFYVIVSRRAGAPSGAPSEKILV